MFLMIMMCYLSKKGFHILIALTLLKANKSWNVDTEQYNFSKLPLTTQVFSAQYFLKGNPEYDSMTETFSFILAISIFNICHFIFWTAVCKIPVGYFLVKYPFFKNVFIFWGGEGNALRYPLLPAVEGSSVEYMNSHSPDTLTLLHSDVLAFSVSSCVFCLFVCAFFFSHYLFSSILPLQSICSLSNKSKLSNLKLKILPFRLHGKKNLSNKNFQKKMSRKPAEIA